MTILERKAFISSNPRIVLSSCPPPCGHFSIQESASGGLSYKVKNTGACTGTEVVQLYIQDVAASTVRPVRELKGFTRITLTPGETQTVSFRISEAELSFHRADGSYGTEPGAFRVWIGGSSATENGTGFTLR